MGEVIVFGLLYLLPTFIVLSNEKKNSKAPTVIVNVFLGCTFVGWVIALAMAASKDK